MSSDFFQEIDGYRIDIDGVGIRQKTYKVIANNVNIGELTSYNYNYKTSVGLTEKKLKDLVQKMTTMEKDLKEAFVF